jgi:DNA-binding LytR/AlgR family response regulator
VNAWAWATRARLEALYGSTTASIWRTPRSEAPESRSRSLQGRAGDGIVTVRVLIVDDEAVARRRIRRLLATDPDVNVVGECADGASALRAITSDKPHIAFLDIQMPEMDGFEVVQAVPSTELPAVVFVTAFDRYALKAFDVHAIDYLLKPFTRERFLTALSRARERLERRATTTKSPHFSITCA